MVVVNKDKLVFVGKRTMPKSDKFWQMPQGGIDSGEEPEEAVKRELQEELGCEEDDFEIIAISKQWYSYEIPKHMRKRHFTSQRQKWFLIQFNGTDDDIDVSQDRAEFSKWKWVEFQDVPKLVIDFKKDVYKKVLKDFRWYFEE